MMAGDLALLTAGERLSYYGKVCESLGLNPLTKPFQYIRLNGKLHALREQRTAPSSLAGFTMSVFTCQMDR